MSNKFSRRDFMAASGGIGLAAAFSGLAPMVLTASEAGADGKPAVLGGTPLNQGAYSHWPILQGDEEKMVLEVLKTGNWFRGDSRLHMVDRFENEYAAMNKAKHCIAVNSGTSALVASMAALEIGPGDEVITSPYTFIATINSVLYHYALPVPVDVDLESFQLDAACADRACTSDTRCLLPVHIGGAPADLDAFSEIAKRRELDLVEDACQAHLGRWRDKNLGTVGRTGCFSLQVSKNLSCGDGGAILTDDDELAEAIFKCHNNCRGRSTDSFDFTYGAARATNQRMTEFQAAVLLGQMKNIEAYAETRQENGMYLNRLLAEIPGVIPAKLYDGTTRNAWHLYMFRIDKEGFGLDRGKFTDALRAERIPCSTGYGAVDWVDFVRNTYASKTGSRLYPKKTLDDWAERVGTLPNFKRLCGEAVWFTQNMLLGPKKNMEIIADAVRRIQKNAAEIAKS